MSASSRRWEMFGITFRAALLLLGSSLFSFASAETLVNRWKPVQIGAQGSSAVAQSGAPAASWSLEPAGDGFVRIRNQSSDQYLNIEQGLAVGPIQPGWWSAQWVLEPADAGFVRIRNRWQAVYLNIEQGSLAATAAQPGWWSAQWQLGGAGGSSSSASSGSSSSVATRAVAEAAVIPRAGIDRARPSYDPLPWAPINGASDSFSWLEGAPFERTLYNPLDGGVLLRYRQSVPQGNSDGCSGPTTGDWKQYFLRACLAHDINYDAPFALAGFPSYEATGVSTGKDLADFLFLKDMQQINQAAERSGQLRPPVTRSLVDTAAQNWFQSVQDWAGFRGKSDNKEILEKGGIVAVKNNGAYVLRLSVEWTAPNGSRMSEQIDRAAGPRAAVIPLSAGARDIKISAVALAGKEIFRNSQPRAGMYAYTVGGATLMPTMTEGLKPDFGNQVADAANQTGAAIREFVTGAPIAAGQRGIKFNNQAGYVASMSVTYMSTRGPMALSTPKISLGFTRPLVVPADVLPGLPVRIVINGVATLKDPVFETTVPGDFSGELCFKAWGTIFDAQGGSCQ